MSIYMQAEQRTHLPAVNYRSVQQVIVELGWTETTQTFGLFGPRTKSIDCDVFAVLLGGDAKLIHHTRDITQCTVFYNNLTWPDGSVRHLGKSINDGCCSERIFVDLQNLPQDVCAILFGACIYDAFQRDQHFGSISGAFIRVLDCEQDVELCRFEMNQGLENMTAIEAGALLRSGDSWEFLSIGRFSRVDNLAHIAAKYGV